MDELLNNIIFVLQKYFIGNKVGMTHFRAEIARFIDAFGGCDKCWGRGYLDVYSGLTYCECERGQDLEKRVKTKL